MFCTVYVTLQDRATGEKVERVRSFVTDGIPRYDEIYPKVKNLEKKHQNKRLKIVALKVVYSDQAPLDR